MNPDFDREDPELQEAQLMLTNPYDASWSVKVTEHSTIAYVRYGFLLVCNSNLVFKTCNLPIFDFKKMSGPWNPSQRSLKVIWKWYHSMVSH